MARIVERGACLLTIQWKLVDPVKAAGRQEKFGFRATEGYVHLVSEKCAVDD